MQQERSIQRYRDFLQFLFFEKWKDKKKSTKQNACAHTGMKDSVMQ